MQIEVKVWLYDVLNAIVEIESYFERVELIAKQTKSLSIDFNPTGLFPCLLKLIPSKCTAYYNTNRSTYCRKNQKE